jgi:integrase
MRGRGTGWIRKKPGGGYFVGWSVAGKQHCVAVSTLTGIPPKKQTKADAQRALDAQRGKAGQFISRSAPGATVAELLDEYLLVLKVRNVASVRQIEVGHRHWKAAYGDLPAARLTSGMLLAWADSMKMRQPSPMMPATIANTIGQLRAAFRYAAGEDPPRLDRLPRFPAIRFNNARQVVLEPAEFVAIHRYLPDGLREAFALAYTIGWRKGEMFDLTWSMIDRHDKVIRLPKSKNGRSRVVPISSEMERILGQAWRAQVLGCPYVFHHKGRQMKRGWSEYHWHRGCEQAGIVDRKFHDTRRAAVQRLIHAGTPERVAMDISGHESMSMLFRYAIKSTKSMQAALAKPALPAGVLSSLPSARPGQSESLWKTGT